MPKTTLHLIDRLVELRNECDFSNDPNRCKEYGDKVRARDIARDKRAIELALEAGEDKTGKEWTVEDKEQFNAITEGRLTIHGLPMTLDDLRMPAETLPSDDLEKGDVKPPAGSPPCQLALHDRIYLFRVDVLNEEARNDPVKDDKSRFDIIIAKVLQELENRPSLMEGDPIPGEMAVSESELRTFIEIRKEWQQEELARSPLILTEREQWIARMFDRLHEKGITEALFGENEDTDVAKPVRQVPQRWTPSPGYVGMKEIQTHLRFQKDGTNPSRSTMQDWLLKPHDQEVAPDTKEIYVREDWINEQINQWSPRSNRNRQP